MKKYNILVTGCGGDIGQSIGKILKSNELFENVIGCDVNDHHAARFIFNRMFTIDPCNSPHYITQLEELIQKFDIDFLLPISEHELRMFTDLKINSNFLGTKLIAANLYSREIGFHKLATAEFLEKVDLPFPKTFIISDVKDVLFPMILKSRKGSGSKSIFLINNQEELIFYQKKYHHFIAQELISGSSDEFTCGLYRCRNGDVRSVIYKRKLVDSYSGYGEVVENLAISQLLESIAEKLMLFGSINVQLKLSEKGPCVFEINPRFSSTVKFRHMMGFEDVIWSILESLEQPIPHFIPPVIGTKFYKGFYEYID